MTVAWAVWLYIAATALTVAIIALERPRIVAFLTALCGWIAGVAFASLLNPVR